MCFCIWHFKSLARAPRPAVRAERQVVVRIGRPTVRAGRQVVRAGRQVEVVVRVGSPTVRTSWKSVKWQLILVPLSCWFFFILFSISSVEPKVPLNMPLQNWAIQLNLSASIDLNLFLLHQLACFRRVARLSVNFKFFYLSKRFNKRDLIQVIWNCIH